MNQEGMSKMPRFTSTCSLFLAWDLF